LNDVGRWSFAEWQGWVDDGVQVYCRDNIVRCRRALRSATKRERVVILRDIVRFQRLSRLR
jgi:hypothetical protein